MLFAQASLTSSVRRSSRPLARNVPDNEATLKTVLVVDDDPAIGQLLQFYLREAGFRPIYVSDGLQALLQASQLRPALILLDVMLPGLDGWEVCRELRRTSDVPIILLTAKDADRDVVSGLGAGATDYITKPFSGPQLMARVERLLRSAESTRKTYVDERETSAGPAPATEPPPPRAGMHMKQSRRRAGMTLLQIEQRIGVRWEYLQALEMHQLDRIPRHLQQAALLRYAEFLGLDPRPLWEQLRAQRTATLSYGPGLQIRIMQAIGAAILLLTVVLAAYFGATYLLLPYLNP